MNSHKKHKKTQKRTGTTDLSQSWSSLPRRAFLGQTALGLGAVALGWLGLPGPSSAGGVPPGVKGLPHFAPKANRVIFLYMSGGPSHLETFDYKPALAEMDGKP